MPDLLPKLKTLVDEHVRKTVEPERRIQLSEIRRNYAYWDAKQYVVPVVYNQEVVDYRTASGNVKYPGDVQDSAYDYCMNQIRGDGKTIISVIGQRAPNVKAIPDKLDDDAAVRMANQVNDQLGRLRAIWKVEQVQRRLAKGVWLSGTQFGHVEWVANGRKYGWVEVPKYRTEMQSDGEGSFLCPVCGLPSSEMGVCPCGQILQPENFQPPQEIPVPVEDGMERYPKGAPELRLESPLRVTTVFYSEGVDTLPWIGCEREEHQAVILAAYNDGKHPEIMTKLWELRNKTASQASLSDMGQMARDGVSSPVPYTAPRPDRWHFAQYWITPEMFMYLKEDAPKFLEAFPDGVKITYVEDEIIDATPARLADEWSVCFPEPNNSMYPDPLCKDYMGIQDLLNDVLNITVETAERAIPTVFYDPTIISEKAWKKNAPAPGTLTPALPGVGARLGDSVVAVKTADLNGQLLGWGESLITRAREIVGASPALSGVESPVQTAYQASRQLNQALMKLSPVWNEMRSFWEQTYLNGLRLLSENDPEAQGLSLDGWHLEVEEAIPMTWGQIRDFFTMLLERGPEAWSLFGLDDPANASIVHTALGLHGWKKREQEERDHILDTIRQLLKMPPVIPPVDPMTGMALGPPQASLPPDDLEFDPTLTIRVVHEWLQGKEAQQAKEQSPDGYLNVTLWARSFMQMLAPPAPPGGPADGGPPPAEGEPLPEGSRDMNQAPAPPPSVTGEPMPGAGTPLPQG